MLSKLLALADLLVRLLDWASAAVKRAKRKERERRHEEIDRDPAGEFANKFDRVRDEQSASVPGDETGTDSSRNASRRDSTNR